MENPKICKALQLYLMTSYLYYHRNRSVIPDEQYDQLAKQLLLRWDTFEHQHKHLISKEDLQAGTLYHLREDQYPKMVVGAALILLTKYEQKRMREM